MRLRASKFYKVADTLRGHEFNTQVLFALFGASLFHDEPSCARIANIAFVFFVLSIFSCASEGKIDNILRGEISILKSLLRKIMKIQIEVGCA